MNFIKKILPPILFDILKKNSFKNKQYLSYKEANLKKLNNGYQNNLLLKNIIYKTKSLKNNNFSNLELDDIRIFVILSLLKNQDNLNILDYGGAAGYYYYLFKKFYKKKLIWNIIENNEFYKIITHDSKSDIPNEINYFKSIEDSVLSNYKIDLVFCSCSLQYSADPLITLEKLISLKAKYIYITRMPLLEKDSKKIYLQYSDLISNGPKATSLYKKNIKVSYPITLINKNEIEKLLFQSYDKIFSMIEDNNAYNFQNENISLYGYLCELKS